MPGPRKSGPGRTNATDQPGGMHVNEAFFLVEIEDVDTGEIIEEPGRRGKMVITALDRHGPALCSVRLQGHHRVGSEARCACGRTFRLIKGGVVGRADDITKVKGVLLAPSAIEEVVRSIPGLGDEYEVIVDRLGDVDRIKLKVELMPDQEDHAKAIESELKDQLRLKTNLGYRIEFYDLRPASPVRCQGQTLQGPAKGPLMNQPYDLNAIDAHIRQVREAAEGIARLGEDFPSLARNAARILAGVKMLELNVSDLLELGDPEA